MTVGLASGHGRCGAAGAPDRHPGNTAGLAPPHAHQEMDPAQCPWTAGPASV